MSITVRNLTKSYGAQKAIDDISFKVEKGEIVGFLGPNGAGKTTTMKILTCFMRPDSGDATIEGHSIHEDTMEIRRRVGYLPETNPLYHDMNVLDYIEYAGKLQHLQGEELARSVRRMVEICGLGDSRHKDIGELSKGYRQRVGLAQAMVHDPDVLLLDEPTSGLDPNQIIEIRNLVKELGREKTVVLSTHILPEVQATCNRVLIIHEGKIAADGTLDDLQKRFQGADEIRVEVKPNGASPEGIAASLKSIEGVTHVEKTGGDNELAFVVYASPGVDLREPVFRTAVKNNWVLLDMHRSGTSLESVFQKLTRSQ